MDREVADVALSEEARRLYMNYALSVITSRALPDVRDGLKPVQRRILFAMFNELRVGPDSKPAKCARIVGDVIGKYHPHGDTAVYDALVRLAQDWVMRAALVRGQGNFGSQDGDAPAAYRYTEARLEAISIELLKELAQKTVPYRPTFDASRSEPVVLPARFPNLLVNGAQGIAVGMATSIPPHNLGEVIDACVALVDDSSLSVARLLGKVKGPDFPTGGELVTSRKDLKQIYETGQGSVKLRGQWKTEKANTVILTALPYALEKRVLVEKIADVIINKKLPGLVDVRDESTDVVRVVLEMKKGTNPDLVMAYLMKHTPLQTNVSINLTCLVPTADEMVCAPERLDLKSILQHFLDFRFDVVTKRLEFELGKINARLHILEGFEKVFDALDEIIRIIRKSDGKKDAAAKIIKRFKLSEEQTEAILELKLYRLAKLEILVVQEEADAKRKEKKRLENLLRGQKNRWKLVKSELLEVKSDYAQKRTTRIVSGDDTPEFSAEDFIVDEDQFVIVTADGWVKRQTTVKDLSTTRLKKDDRVLACVHGSTRASVAFFGSSGHCYVMRIADVPSSTGYGDPVQKHFKFKDGERLVGAVSLDPRYTPMADEDTVYEDGTPIPPYGVAVTKGGLGFRFPLWPHKDPSTKNGRKYSRLKAGDEVQAVFTQLEEEEGFVMVASSDGHALSLNLEDLAVLAGPGRGTILIKLSAGVEVMASKIAPSKRTEPLIVRTEKGKKYELFVEGTLGTRGGRGKAVVKRTGFATTDFEMPEIPEVAEE